MKYFTFSYVKLFNAILMGLLFSTPLFAHPPQEARIEQLQNQMEEAVNQGQGVPPGMMEEMQKLLDESEGYLPDEDIP